MDVLRNDKFRLEELKPYDKIILSPGPGVPEEAGLLLDVCLLYTSQVPGIEGVLLCIAGALRGSGNGVDIGTVSYTHLDVYKRQLLRCRG